MNDPIRCAVSHSICHGLCITRIFLWRATPRNAPPHKIILPCVLCEHHYQRILDENRGAVPEIAGDTKEAALDNLLMGLEDDFDIVYSPEEIDCTSCTNEAYSTCDRCKQPLCLTCINRAGYYCCWIHHIKN